MILDKLILQDFSLDSNIHIYLLIGLSSSVDNAIYRDSKSLSLSR